MLHLLSLFLITSTSFADEPTTDTQVTLPEEPQATEADVLPEDDPSDAPQETKPTDTETDTPSGVLQNEEQSEIADLSKPLLLLFSDATALDGIKQLKERADAQAIPALIQVAEHRPTAIAKEAALALSVFPSALPALTRWLDAEDLSLEVAIAAAEALGQMRTPEAETALLDALNDGQARRAVRAAIVETIYSYYPDNSEQITQEAHTNAAPWLAMAGAHSLGLALATAGYFGQSNLTELGAISGVAAGAAGGLLLSKKFPLEAAEGAFITTNGVNASVGGSIIAASLFQPLDVGDDSQERAALLGGLAGEIAGYSLGIAFREHPNRSVLDSVEASFIGYSSLLVAGGLTTYYRQGSRSEWRNPSRYAPEMLASGLALVGGQTVGHWLAPRVDFELKDSPYIALGAVYGLNVGLLLPTKRPLLEGLPAATMAVGALAGYALAPKLNTGYDTLLGGATGMTFGGVIGLGSSMLINPDWKSDRMNWAGGALIGETVGLVAGGYLAQRNPAPVSPNDIVFTGLVTGWTTWQMAGWYSHFSPQNNSLDGLYVMTPALIGAGVAAAGPRLDIPIAYSAAALSFGTWGGYYGGTLAKVTNSRGLMPTLVGSNLGLASGLLFASTPLVETPFQLMVINSGGVLGGSLVALGTAFITTDSNTILVSSLAGSAVGLAGGVVASKKLKRAKDRQPLAFLQKVPKVPGDWSVMPTALRGSQSMAWGATVQGLNW